MFDTDRIGFAGDWHGNEACALRALDTFATNDIHTIYHLGDFGVWPGGRGIGYRSTLNKRLIRNNQYMIVTLGNHEDYDQIETWPQDGNGFIVEPTRPRILYCTRGQVWQHMNIRFASLGGAFSIDKGMRRPNVSWWPQEEIRYEDVLALKDNMKSRGWDYVDVFLSHDFPEGVPLPALKFMLPDDLENESKRQREVLRHAYDFAQPIYAFHGHWHTQMDSMLHGKHTETGFSYWTNIFGLAEDGNTGNLATARISEDYGLVAIRVL